MEAIDGPTEITGFETGVFTGKYQTEVPESYFKHLSDIRSKGKKRKSPGDQPQQSQQAVNGGDAKKLTLVANGGPVNVASPEPEPEKKNLTSQEDIRYVFCSPAPPSVLATHQ